MWVLGPHFKCLFILALITRSNPTADTVVCVRKGLECNAEVPLRKPVSLTKHYFLACAVGLSEPPHDSPAACLAGAPVDAQHQILIYAGPFYLTLLSNVITIMYIRVLFVVVDCCRML